MTSFWDSKDSIGITVATDDDEVSRLLTNTPQPGPKRIREVLSMALTGQGLESREIAELLLCDDPAVVAEICQTARQLKREIYGRRVVLTAKISLQAVATDIRSGEPSGAQGGKNGCQALSQEAIADEAFQLLEAGHKRVALVVGDLHRTAGWEYIHEAIATVWNARHARAKFRRINLRTTPLHPEDLRRARRCRVGTIQLYQMTYHLPTFLQMHRGYSEFDYRARLSAPVRALAAGTTDLGLGVSFGLYDYRYEVLALARHVNHLREIHGIGPRTISISSSSQTTGRDPSPRAHQPISSSDIRKIVCILRLAVRHTGIIVNVPDINPSWSDLLALGVSQVSVTRKAERPAGDQPGLDQIVREVLEAGYLPSFCTACYYLERSGVAFEDQAARGLIKRSCLPNSLLTLQEYLEDYGSPETRQIGEGAIRKHLEDIRSPSIREQTERRLERVSTGAPEFFH